MMNKERGYKQEIEEKDKAIQTLNEKINEIEQCNNIKEK